MKRLSSRRTSSVPTVKRAGGRPDRSARRGDDGEGGAAGLAADDESIRAELGAGVLRQPEGRGLAVVGAGGIGVLGCEAVLDAEDGDVAGVGKGFQARVLLPRGAQRPAAGVEVEVGALDAPRDERSEEHTAELQS